MRIDEAESGKYQGLIPKTSSELPALSELVFQKNIRIQKKNFSFRKKTIQKRSTGQELPAMKHPAGSISNRPAVLKQKHFI